MHHVIAVGRGGDQAWFGIANHEAAIGTRGVGQRPQLALQLEQLRFQATVEGEHIGAIALAALGGPGGGEQVGEAGEAREEIMEKRLAPRAAGGWAGHQAGGLRR